MRAVVYRAIVIPGHFALNEGPMLPTMPLDTRQGPTLRRRPAHENEKALILEEL